jgi:hypothetical protein
MRNAYTILVGKPEGKRPRGRKSSRWENNIEIDPKQMVYEGADWINLIKGMVH